jgi:hypothetical protein
LTRIIRSHSSRVISSNGDRDIGTTEKTAALLTRPVIVPNSATVPSTIAFRSASSEMSARKASARPPDSRSSPASFSAPSPSRSTTTTAAPSATSARA